MELSSAIVQVSTRQSNVHRLGYPALILDRIPLISNLVYATVERRNTFLRPREYLSMTLSLNFLAIYCRSKDPEKQRSRISHKPKPHKPPEYLGTVKDNFYLTYHFYEFYMGLLAREGLTVLNYDFESDTEDNLVHKIRDRMLEEKR